MFKRLFKFFYYYVPLKKEAFLVIKYFVRFSPKLYKHLHFRGVFTVRIDPHKSFKIIHYGYQIENELFWAGIQNGWEKESIKLWIELCSISNTIIDVGANTGIYSLVAQTVNPSAKIVAFEPVENVYNKLNENCRMNHFPIKTINKALSNYNGAAVIYLPSLDHTYSVTVNENLNNSSIPVIEQTIQVIKLKSFIEEFQIMNIDLMKIDVETHEVEVLEGMEEYLISMKPTMIIEVLNDEVGKRIQALVSNCNYLFFNIDENGGVKKVDQITKSDYYNYLLCSTEIAQKLNLQNKDE